MTKQQRIKDVSTRLSTQLKNDARYWDLCRTYGDYSDEVLRYLEICDRSVRAGKNVA